jgi:hypothetical protein
MSPCGPKGGRQAFHQLLPAWSAYSRLYQKRRDYKGISAVTVTFGQINDVPLGRMVEVCGKSHLFRKTASALTDDMGLLAV